MGLSRRMNNEACFQHFKGKGGEETVKLGYVLMSASCQIHLTSIAVGRRLRLGRPPPAPADETAAGGGRNHDLITGCNQRRPVEAIYRGHLMWRMLALSNSAMC